MMVKLLSRIFKSTLFLVLATATTALAAPASLTYQGRILKTDGSALEYNNVSFIFQIMDPNGSCVLFQEQVDGYDMTNSGGVFDTPIGAGTRNYPVTGVFNILDSLNNSTPLPCQGGATFTPQVTDGRILRVQFYEGTGWKVITPDNVIRSVPYAGYAVSSGKLGNNVASDFILKTGLPTCTAGTFLFWDGTALSCAPVAGASGGTVTNVTAAAPLIVTTGSSTPALSITQASTSTNGYLSSTDWNTFNSKLSPTAAFVGDVSGTYGATSVDKIKGTALTIASLATGNFLKYNGTAWVNSALAIGDVSGLTTQLGNKLDVTNMPGSCAANQTLTFSSPSGAWVCSTIAITGTAFGSQSANLVFAGPDLASGTPTFRALTANDLPATVAGGLWAVSGSDVYRAGGYVGIGTTTMAVPLVVYKMAPTGTIATTGTAVTGTGTNFDTSFAVGDVVVAAGQSKTITAIASATAMTLSAGFSSDLAASTAYTRVGTVLNAGNVGIGVATPSAKLSVLGTTADSSALALNVANSSGTSMLSVRNDGKVGVGITSPITALSNHNSNLVDSGGTGTNSSSLSWNNAGTGYTAAFFNSSTGGGLLVKGATTLAAPIFAVDQGTVGATAGSSLLRVQGNGNVGVGTATPGYKLDVNGIVNATGFYLNGSTFTAGSASTAVAATGGSASSITQSATDAASAVRTALTVQNTGTGGANEYLIVGKNAAGTTTYSVNQTGDVTSNSLITPKISGSTVASGTLTLDSTTNATKGSVLIAPTGGYVGVGTTAPASTLDISSLNTSTLTLRSTSTGGVIETINMVDNGATGSIANSWWTGYGMTFTTPRDLAGRGFAFNSNSGTNRMFIDAASGFVGIGSTSPTVGLDVETGSLKINNNITGAGQTGTLYLGDGTLSKAYGGTWTFNSGIYMSGTLSATGIIAPYFRNTGADSGSTAGWYNIGSLTASSRSRFKFVSWVRMAMDRMPAQRAKPLLSDPPKII